MGDIDTVVVDSLKALDLERPIREADIDLFGEGPIAVFTPAAPPIADPRSIWKNPRRGVAAIYL